MEAKLWDGFTVKFSGIEVKEIRIEEDDYSILICWKDGRVERAESIHI